MLKSYFYITNKNIITIIYIWIIMIIHKKEEELLGKK